MDLVDYTAHRGGIASREELLSAGARPRDLTRLVAERLLARPRMGWYSTLTSDHPRFRAVRIGGKLTGASALAEMGAWMLHPPTAIEVAVSRGSARLRPDPEAVIHWVDDRCAPASASVVGLGEALVRVILDHDLEVSVPCVDWALSSGRLDRFAFEQLLLALPRSARSIGSWVDGRSQSVLESVARVRVRRRGWRAETQVRVGELGAIDLVVGGVVALELDGREHHEASFEADRRKDLSILLEQRIPVRVTYSMLVHEWARIEGAISAVLATPGRRRAHDSVIAPAPPGGRRHARGARRIFD